MNNTSKIIAGLALIASLASCSQKAEFQSSSYVRFNAEAYSVKEDAGTVRLPVYAYPKNGETSFPRAEEAYTEVSFEIVENSAKAGENFTVEPANGILTFDGESVAYITLNITNLEGEYTSDLDFTIKLTGATRDYTIGAFHTASITIVDNDHPLAAILGSYTANVVDYWGGSLYDRHHRRPCFGKHDGGDRKRLVPLLRPCRIQACVKRRGKRGQEPDRNPYRPMDRTGRFDFLSSGQQLRQYR